MTSLKYLAIAVGCFAMSHAAMAEDIITRPLPQDTGDYAETPVSRPPKDSNLKRIWEEAEEGGYLRELEQAIDESGGTRLKEEWSKKEDD